MDLCLKACSPILNFVFCNGALVPSFHQKLVSQMQNLAFTLAADGSNDSELTKMNPVTMKIYDVNTSKVESNFLDMCISQ